MDLPKKNDFSFVAIPVLLVAVMWVVKYVEIAWQFDFWQYGILPRDLTGLRGILLAPFIHGDCNTYDCVLGNWNHLFNNSVPMIVLGMGLFYFYRPVAWRIIIWSVLMSGLWVWVAARPNYHIGASGLVYALWSFIFFSGVIRKHGKLLSLSMLVVFLYGSLVWGIFPIDQKISFEGHMFGALAGLFLAYYFRKEGPQRERFEWEDEEEEDDELPPDVLYEKNGVTIRYTYKENGEGSEEEQ